MIIGSATPKGTTTYASKHTQLTYQPLGTTGLHVSQAGFGCYRVDAKNQEHLAPMRKAIQSGINLIDTSSNYANGGSEQLVGRILAELCAGGVVEREQVVVVSKGGYLQGDNYELSQQRRANDNAWPDLVPYSMGLEHCIHPDFLADQIERSLARLELETIDVYLLHNPEYFLGYATKQAGYSVEDARIEYYRRIELAFRHLEEEVEAGRINAYGISSNSFPSPSEYREFTSLERVWEIAESISPNHHFRVIQLPQNLIETGGATERNQSTEQTVLEFADEKQIGVLINRPLNAVIDNTLVRLADGEPAPPISEQEIAIKIESLQDQERELRTNLIDTIPITDEERKQVVSFLAVGGILDRQWKGFGSYTQWREIRNSFIIPRINSAAEFVMQQALPLTTTVWLEGYMQSVKDALEAVSNYFLNQDKQRADHIRETVANAHPDWKADNLSGTAVRALRTTQGVNSVLVGMRQLNYVTNILEELSIMVDVNIKQATWDEIKRELNSIK